MKTAYVVYVLCVVAVDFLLLTWIWDKGGPDAIFPAVVFAVASYTDGMIRQGWKNRR